MILPLPALLYHKVTFKWEVGITWATPQQFQSQILFLRKGGWTPVKLTPLTHYPPHSFTLLFDDGYEDLYRYVFPLSGDLAVAGTIFIPAGFIGQENSWDHQLLGRRHRHLTREQIQEMHRFGWSVGSHSLTHRPLTHLSNSDLKRELKDSKAILEDITGDQVRWLSFPFGRYNIRVLKAVMEAGYQGIIIPEPPSSDYSVQLLSLVALPVYWGASPAYLERRLMMISSSERVDSTLLRLIRWANRGTYWWGELFRRWKYNENFR